MIRIPIHIIHQNFLYFLGFPCGCKVEGIFCLCNIGSTPKTKRRGSLILAAQLFESSRRYSIEDSLLYDFKRNILFRVAAVSKQNSAKLMC